MLAATLHEEELHGSARQEARSLVRRLTAPILNGLSDYKRSRLVLAAAYRRSRWTNHFPERVWLRHGALLALSRERGER